MPQKQIDFWVGCFVFIGLLALTFLAIKAGNLGNTHFRHSYQLTASFDNTGGLKPGAPVRSSGVVVGRVATIHFDNQHYQAIVTLTMDSRYTFPEDTSAKILTAGLLGEQYIGLEPGGETTPLSDGSTIQLTQSAVVLENLIGQFLYGKATE